MAFSLKRYGSTPYWGVNTQQDAVNDAAIITSASFSTSTQKYETVNSFGTKVGVLYYDAECAFSIQGILLVKGSAGPDTPTTSCSPFLTGLSPCDQKAASSMPIYGKIAAVTAPTWVFSNGDGNDGLYPAIDSVELSMSNTDARSVTISGTIYSLL